MKKLLLRLFSVGLLCISVSTCSLFFADQVDEKKEQVDSVKFSQATVSVSTGGVAYVPLVISPVSTKNDVSFVFDSRLISIEGDKCGVTIHGIAPGTTTVKASCGDKTSVCVVTINGQIDANNNPYITVPLQSVQLEVGYDKTINATLAGGTLADMSAFLWSTDDESIAKVSFVGQTGNIKALKAGVTRLIISHPKSAYNAEVLIIIKSDTTNPIYITTSQNILTLQKDNGDKTVAVQLLGKDSADSLFTWTVDKSDIIKVTSTGKDAVLTPLKSGEAKITVTHPDSIYPLSLIVRVVSIVDNVFIEPSESMVTVRGSQTPSITAKIIGNVSDADNLTFHWAIDSTECADMVAFGNTVMLVGKKNGTAKITVSHEKAAYAREILVLVKDQSADAINASKYLTTTQTYTRFIEGGPEQIVSVQYVGGVTNEENNLQWSIEDPTIAEIIPINGSIVSRAVSVFSSTTTGRLRITPKKAGTTVIVVTHPAVLNPLKILVTVYPQGTNLSENIYIKGDNLIGFVKGQTKQVNITLVNSNDTGKITWKSLNETVVSLTSTNDSAVINARSCGETYIEIAHPFAETSKKILCYVANTEAELASYCLLYSQKLNYKLVMGAISNIDIASNGLIESELTAITWSINDPTIALISSSGTHAEITPLKVGTTVITASHTKCVTPVSITITVYPEGTKIDEIPAPIYLTTERNVININPQSAPLTTSITAVGLNAYEFGSITWTIQDSTIASIVPNGNKLTITPLKEGSTKVIVSHPKSENTLEIHIRVGSEYIITNPTVTYITATADVIQLVSGGLAKTITTALFNGTDNNGLLFTWTIDKPEIATIATSGKTCIITPKIAGQARLTIHHPESKYDKQILLIVDNNDQELSAFKYITTAQNIINLAPGFNQTLSVRLVGKKETDNDSDFQWSIDNANFASVVANGNTAIITGLAEGVAKITIKHASALYPIDIIINVLSKEVYNKTPVVYITTSQNIAEVPKGSSKSLSVTLVGGTASDNSFFNWSLDRYDIASITANGNTALIKANTVGEVRVTITNPKSLYEATIIVIIAPTEVADQYYIAPSKSILTMKPADSEQTLNVKLIGGNSTDIYGFKWVVDRYDIIDITTNNEQAIVTPLKEGTAVITVTHPKTNYKCEIVVRVTEYTKFSFSQSNVTTKEGDTIFIPMQVPSFENNYDMNITYSTDNPAICIISGTNKVAQLTAVAAGTTIVKAKAPSGVTSELLVYVRKNDSSTGVFVTTSTNVISLKSTSGPKEISAQLVGGTPAQQSKLVWTLENPTIAKLLGAGPSVQITPLKVGETKIVISHPDTATTYTIYVQVTGVAQGISLNKSYINLPSGNTAEISANIDNGTAEDYKLLTWTAEKVNGEDLVSILGTQKTVQLFALKAGQTRIRATSSTGAFAECDVLIESNRSISLATASIRLAPGETRVIKYTVVPVTNPVTWYTSTADNLTYVVNTVANEISITGVKEGTTTITATAGGMSASLSAVVAWDYSLTIDKSLVKAEPRVPVEINYACNPANTEITAALLDDSVASISLDTVNKKIILTPLKEGQTQLQVTHGAGKIVKTCAVSFLYTQVTLKPKMIYTGSFSTYSQTTQKVYIGDGESVDMTVAFDEPNVGFMLKSVVTEGSATPVLGKIQIIGNTISLKHPTDLIDAKKGYYYIPQTYVLVSRSHLRQRLKPEVGWDYNDPFGRFYSIEEIANGQVNIMGFAEEDFRHGQDVKIAPHLKDVYIQAELWNYTNGKYPQGTNNILIVNAAYFINLQFPNAQPCNRQSYDTTIKSITNAETLVITIIRNNKEEIFRIPTYVVTRDCSAFMQTDRPVME